jgi:O-antigen ligase
VHGPHSVYFGVLGEQGFVGLGLYLTLVIACLISTWRIGRLARALDDPVSERYARMLRLSLIAFLTSGVFLGRAYFDYYFTIVGCIVILNRLLRERAIEEPVLEFAAEAMEMA